MAVTKATVGADLGVRRLRLVASPPAASAVRLGLLAVRGELDLLLARLHDVGDVTDRVGARSVRLVHASLRGFPDDQHLHFRAFLPERQALWLAHLAHLAAEALEHGVGGELVPENASLRVRLRRVPARTFVVLHDHKHLVGRVAASRETAHAQDLVPGRVLQVAGVRGDGARRGELPELRRVLFLNGVVIRADQRHALEAEVRARRGGDSGRKRGRVRDRAVRVELDFDDLRRVLVRDGEVAAAEGGDALQIQSQIGDVERVHQRVVLVRASGDFVHLTIAVVHDEDVSRLGIVGRPREVGLRARELEPALGHRAEAAERRDGEPFVSHGRCVRGGGEEAQRRS